METPTINLVVCVPTKGGTYCGHPVGPDPLWMWPLVLIIGIIGAFLVTWICTELEKWWYRHG